MGAFVKFFKMYQSILVENCRITSSRNFKKKSNHIKHQFMMIVETLTTMRSSVVNRRGCVVYSDYSVNKISSAANEIYLLA